MKNVLRLLFLLTFVPVTSKSSAAAKGFDTITIEAGKPVVLIISIFKKDSEAEPFFARREEAELQQNFPDYDVRVIDSPSVIEFENSAHDRGNYSFPEHDQELVIFWDGMPESRIKSENIKVKLTEYVSSFTGAKKTSSYLAENQKIFAQIARMKALFNPDKDSKALTQHYIIDYLFNSMVYGPDTEFAPLTHQDFKTVKHVKVFAKQGDQPEREVFEMGFNAAHLVSDLSYVASVGSGEVKFVYTYNKDGLLTKLVNTDGMDLSSPKPIVTEYSFGYDKGHIMEFSPDQMTQYSVENGVLLADTHYEYIGYDRNFRIESTNEKFEDGCKVSYGNGLQSESYCMTSYDGKAPVSYTRNKFENGELARTAKGKIERDGNTIRISGLNPRTEEFRQTAAITLNDKGLTETVDGGEQRGIKQTLRFAYEYF
ncbi:MAG: hypothetical protein EOO48_01295 [Flavobacterium sp.]|nr:MAG: hypothetical protein EOO48_01295 [Flavobacterium sp.]